MKEVIIFARAGQGAITSAQILGSALVKTGFYAYAFPHFGAARMGAPMNAFLRYDEKVIRLRTRIKTADYAMVVDETLFESQNVLDSLKNNSFCLINSQKTYSNTNGKKIISLPANKISQEITGRMFANTVLLGAFCVINNDVKIDLLYEAMKERFKGKVLDLNLKLAKEGYNFAKNLLK
ncbi:MAG: 2-oxoacid:acceptor oxidoreductase family protein [Elusimicrobiota bacterium]|nr:2-oxoacid:acceptor oxidoreductase family protein [Endomicrobiia bacterium]MDW8164965.1 2-oxoacid:acceptor oxidoreductase family protein [Elusimicrobiota bacterium]